MTRDRPRGSARSPEDRVTVATTGTLRPVARGCITQAG
jgi:hypothetical protein